MNCKKLSIVCLTAALTLGIGLGVGTVASAATVLVDFHSPDPPGQQAPTPQAGWNAFLKDVSGGADPTVSQTETYTASFGLAGTVDVTLDPDLDGNYAPGVFPQWANRDPVTGGPGAAIGNMLGGRWGVSTIPEGQARIPLTISDLVNGPYELTIYHHDTPGLGGTWDSITANGVTASGGLTSTGTSPDPVGQSFAAFNVTSNVADILFTKTTGTGEVTVTGFELKFIPEPGTLALLATGLIGLLCYGWRKRR